MQMELVMVYALVSGRTFVLPADQPMYLMFNGKGHENVHSFADYFPFDWIGKRLKVITMEQFLEREGVTGKLYRQNTTANSNIAKPGVVPLVVYPPKNRTVHDCGIREEKWALFHYLRDIGASPKFQSYKEFIAFPKYSHFNHLVELNKTADTNSERYRFAKDVRKRIGVFAGARTARYYSEYWQKQKVVHFITHPEEGYRLLEHFYSFIFFDDEVVDHFVKRFVRDYVHYIDLLFCKAALIVNSLLTEANGGGYSSFHARRYVLLFVCMCRWVN